MRQSSANSVTLVKNITQCRLSWRVAVERRGIRYTAYFAFGADQAAALERAIAERDRFYAVHGTAARSNTGIAGISETVKWIRNRSYDCFQVTFGDSRQSRPVQNVPEGRQRIRLRTKQVGSVFIKTSEGLRHFELTEIDGSWVPFMERGRNYRKSHA